MDTRTASKRVLEWIRRIDPLPGRRVLPWAEYVLAVLLAGAAPGSTAAGPLLTIAVGAAAGLPFALIRTSPFLGWIISVAGAVTVALTAPVGGSLWPFPFVHGLTLMALVAAVCSRERAAPAVIAWAVTSLLFCWGAGNQFAPGWALVVSGSALIGLLIGMLVRSNRKAAEQAVRGEQERARRIVLEERARIARDLHDVVAHHMSLVVVQAETAPYRVPGLPDEARRELAAIGETARSALTETRSLLAVLRHDDDAPAHAPQPGLDRLAELVDVTRRAGVDLYTEVGAGLDDLRPGVSLAAYRIAQEALANATRHAPGSPVRMVVHRDGDGLRLRIVNGPPADGSAPSGPAAAGHGITGMRERARAEGGELTATPSPDGGFAVDAVLPSGARR